MSISSIKLSSGFDGYVNSQGEVLQSLEPMSRINIFVGANNSGKSRFMRLLASQTEYKAFLEDIDINQINTKITRIANKIRQLLADQGILSINNLEEQDIKLIVESLPDHLNLNNFNYKYVQSYFKNWNSLDEINMARGSGARYLINSPEENKQELIKQIQSLSKEALDILDRIPVYQNLKKFYIPAIRGLRPLDDIHSDLYANRTTIDYFSSSDKAIHPEVFTGLSLYQRLIEMLLGDNRDRRIIADYQQFISDKLFEGRQIALIPNPRSKVVVVKIGNEKEQPIYNLGDGIQSAIILSFLPYITKEESFFFIEEPEMYLHPGLQRKLLNFFASCKQHTFFMTTHSNHFLDITIDIKEASIFTFRKQLKHDETDEIVPTFSIESVDSGHHSSLELLGVRNSSVFLVNATVWVEGITDRLYLRKMLQLYMDHLDQTKQLKLHLEEDVHFSFVEYGGGNITHWSFLDYDDDDPIDKDIVDKQALITVKRLCSRAIVIIDKDDDDAKTDRKEKLTQALNDDRLIILPCREIENLLPYDVIKRVVLEYEGTLDRQLPEFEYLDYQDKKLGEFIQNRILSNDQKRKGTYRDKSGTITDKVGFCKRAIRKLVYDELPQTTKGVIEQIYQFILRQNR